MVLFAGPIVIEWYWIPIFIVVCFVLPVLTVGAHLRGHPPGPGRDRSRGRSGAGCGRVVAVAWCCCRSSSTWRSRSCRRAARRGPPRARSTSRRTSRDRSRHLFTVQAVSGTPGPPRLERHYLIGSSGATASEQRPGGRLVAQDGRCALAELSPKPPSGAANGARPGASRCSSPRFPVSSPAARRSPCSTARSCGCTFEPLPEEYVLAYFDSLRPVDKDDIEFTRA